MAIPKPVFPDRAIERAKVAEDKCVEIGGKVIYEPYSCFVPPPPPPTPEPVATAVTTAPVASQPVTGSCHDWMAAAGIVDQASAYQLILKESGCNPNSVNKSSGACGIGQQLPCGKWPHPWNEPVGAMIDMQAYVFGRYGTWANAWAFWLVHGWY